MESQMQRPAHQHIEQDNLGLHSGETDQTGEKKSVMKKVKDKAKKLKDTIKKQGQGQGQEPEYRFDENVDEEDDDDEEIVKDRGIHGAAPTYDSTVISSTNLPMQLDRDEERPTDTEVKLGPSLGLQEDPHSTKLQPGDAPSNYETKASDPTGDGGKEAGVGHLIRQFDDFNVGKETETEPQPEQKPFSGSHDQFNPESNPLSALDKPESVPKSVDSSTAEGMPRDTVTGKVSSAASALSDKAISVKNAVASKLGYGGGSGQEGSSPSNKPESESAPGYTQKITDTLNPVYQKVAGAGTAVKSKFQGGGEAGNQGGGEGISPSNKPGSEPAPCYTQKIAETLNPVYEKVAGAGSAVMSKFQGSGDTAATDTDKGVSAKEYWSEKLKPGDEDKALSEAITDALHKKKEGYLQKTGEEKTMGQVTESVDVATHLGTGVGGKREGEDALDAGRQSSGPGVVGRVKDAVGSWMGKGTGTQTAQESISDAYVDNAGGKPRSQE